MNNLRTAWTAFKGTGLPTRLHVAVRVLTCPFTPLMKRFPATGALLDVGCGHGLLVHLLAGDPSRRHLKLHGVDHDSAKIAVARRAAGASVEFSTANLSFFPESAFDAVSIIDVLYTVRQSAWNEILQGCARVLRPEGRLIVKEVVDRPRWKYWAIMAQEALAVRVFRITRGERPHFESSQSYREAIVAAGFEIVEDRPLPSATWISHYLWVGKKM
jgi:2-polyprenyl-3-methyl-5-hydroxy-6-metoxy-1,4-benzoquinol methylase